MEKEKNCSIFRMWEFGITKLGIQSKRRSAKNVEIHRNVKGGNGKPRKIWNHKAQNSVQMSKGMFCDRNLLGMSTKKMEKKISRKTQNTEKRFAVRIFSKCQREKWKENQGKFRITKLKRQRINQKEWLPSVQNLFRIYSEKIVKKINFSLTGDLIDVSAFTVGKFFEIIFRLRP